MHINSTGMNEIFLNGAQQQVEVVTEFFGRAVQVFQKGLDYVHQDGRVAGTIFVVANIVLMLTASLIAILVEKLLGVIPEDESALTKEGEWKKKAVYTAKSWLILGAMVSYLVGMNIALVKVLKPGLSPGVIGAISTATCVGYFLFRLWIGSKPHVATEVAETPVV